MEGEGAGGVPGFFSRDSVTSQYLQGFCNLGVATVSVTGRDSERKEFDKCGKLNIMFIVSIF